MRIIWPVILSLALSALASLGAGSCRAKQPSPRVIVNGVTFAVEVAATDSQRRRGLSGRRGLPPDRGMLFVFGRPQELLFHMKDCHFPIDIAFIDEGGTILRLDTMTVEPDPANPVRVYPCDQPAKYVLETVGGTWRRIGARAGMKVRFVGVRAEEMAARAVVAPRPTQSHYAKGAASGSRRIVHGRDCATGGQGSRRREDARNCLVAFRPVGAGQCERGHRRAV